MPRCLIGLGANLGDPAATLDAAVAALGGRPRVTALAASKYLETAPIGGPSGQGKFLNACATIETDLSPGEVVRTLLDVEASLGRTRRTRWEARLLDLDLLLYDAATHREEGVEVPHPRMPSRRFVLDPASEIAADMIHPTTGWTVGAMADHLRTAPNVACVTGLPGVGKSMLVKRLTQVDNERRPPVRGRFDEIFDKVRPPLCATGAMDEQIAAMLRESIAEEALLEAFAWPDPSVGSVVLDFWGGQSLLWMERYPDAEARIVGWLRELPRPKLLIDLYLPTNALLERWIERGWAVTADRDRVEHWVERWRAILREHSPAPWIRVDASNPESAFAETLAALEAMRG